MYNYFKQIYFNTKEAFVQVTQRGMQPDSQGLHLHYPRYGKNPDTGWSRGTQILGA